MPPEIHVIEDCLDHSDLIVWALQSLRCPIRLYRNGESFLRQVFDRPGCVILDLVLPGRSGFAVIDDMKSRRLVLPVIALAGMSAASPAVKAMRAGVLTVLEKPVDVVSLRQAVLTAIAKDDANRKRRQDRAAIIARLAGLDEIHRDLLRAILNGATNREASQRLDISLRTAERHRATLLRLLECRTINEAVALLAKADIEI